MEALNTSRRGAHYDVLRVLSMAAVVGLHVAASALRQGEDPVLWHVSNVLTALCSAAVPLFFMLSGALLLGSERTADPGYLLRRRLPRILVPLLSWSALVLALMWYSRGARAALERLLILPSLTVLTPYWFLYALVPLYLLSPLLRRMAEHLEERHWRYLLLLWLILTVGAHTAWSFVPAPWNGLFQFNAVYNVDLVGGYLGYFLLGAWLDRLERLPSRRVLRCTVLAVWAAVALGTWFCCVHTGYYDERFKDYLCLPVAVLSTALFLLGRSHWQDRASGRALTFLAENSFGVYLSHPMAIFCIRLPESLPGGTVGLGLMLAAVLLACLAGSALVGSVPGLCFLITGRHFRRACKNSNLFALFRGREPDKP